ncbi:medium chain dehydrogenase/reductase family protein [Micromonospora sp. 4G55]|uniref:synaptic vesicle VAT-1 family membrane protein n=1 Tax=Micromonospora sp. 4G55 TaxID=2806102 RepID=UPI001A5C9626|nr:medium chain dehydrogenase/reductase family protein [Micromonospora sp. 4G55]MBM0257151.1 zinc-binding dehydrogenase [Micromonospora sp. 4G55]
MRAVWITKAGGPEVLEVRETPDPEPAFGEVRIRVRAAGLNFAEVMARMGLYPDAPRTPCVVGYEVAGVVDAVGEGVTDLATGTRVIALPRFGGHAEAICVPAEQVVPMPQEMSFEDGAALPVNYITAYHMLFRIAAIRPGERVLVHMAAGGVGLAALQLCKTVDRVVTFGTASASKHDVLRTEGCTHPIDYRTKDYAVEVSRLTKGTGVDVVLDALGGRDWRKGYGLLRPTGRLIAFGFANMSVGERRNLLRIITQAISVPRFTPLGMMEKNRAVAGVNVGHLWGEIDMLRENLLTLLQLYREGKIRPTIDRAFPFAEAADAHLRIQERRNIGKVILIP